MSEQEQTHEEEQKPKEVENAVKERDYSTKRQVDGGQPDSSGSGQSGERFGGRFFGGGRTR